MSGIVSSLLNHRGSGIVAKLGTDGHTLNSGGAGKKAVTEAVVVVADGVDGTKLADNAVDSEHYTDGSIDNAHIADDAIDSEHYADGSIDNAHIADDAIDSEHYAAGSIDTAHIADNQVTLAKMDGLARGKLIYGDASGDPAALAVGTADQVLTHDGTDLSWEDAGGGGAFTLVASTTGTSNVGSVSVDNCFTSTYENYLITFRISNNADERQIYLKWTDAATSQHQTNDYRWGWVQAIPSGTGNDSAGTTGATITGNNYTYIMLSENLEGDNGYSLAGHMFVYNPYSTTYRTTCSWSTFCKRQSGENHLNHANAMWDSLLTVQGFDIYPSAGYIDHRAIRVYGIADS